jgi:hypothetical protein
MQSKLFFGVIPYPSAVALKIKNLGRPPSRQGVPFLRNLIEANWNGCHWVPPGTRQFESTDKQRITTTEIRTETMAYS